MRISLSWRYICVAILAALWLTAISSYVQVSSERYMGSSCGICMDIQYTGDIQHMGVPLAYLTHYPPSTLDGKSRSFTELNKVPLVADFIVWLSVALVGALLISNAKFSTVRKKK